MLKIYTLILCASTGITALAQPGWNWPEDPAQEKLAKEKQAYYRMQLELKNYEAALGQLLWLFENAPDLNESIYIDGAKILDNMLESGVTEPRQTILEDSLLWTYDERIRRFNNEAAVLDRKAYSAFKIYYKDKEKYPLLLDLYEQLYSFDADTISDFNLTPYMTLATYYYKSNPQEMPIDRVLDIHSTITEVIDQKKGNGGDIKKLQKEQDKVDAFLGSLGETLSCDFIEMNLVPKFNEDSTNVGLAKKIFSYALKAKCIDKPYFIKAGEIYYQENPSFSLAKTLADRFLIAGQLEKAEEYYEKAKVQASNNDQRLDVLLGKASVLGKQGEKSKARAMAYEALSIEPEANEAYNLIGNLYFTSYEQCKGGKSKVLDRAIFIAAYEMYQKAGNNQQMSASREQFPSIEEIFEEGYEEGQKVTVNCWVNESVALQRRPQ